jgi:hypothetical protein
MTSTALRTKADVLKFLEPYEDDAVIRVKATDVSAPMDLGNYMFQRLPGQPVTLTLILLDKDGLPIVED